MHPPPRLTAAATAAMANVAAAAAKRVCVCDQSLPQLRKRAAQPSPPRGRGGRRIFTTTAAAAAAGRTFTGSRSPAVTAVAARDTALAAGCEARRSNIEPMAIDDGGWRARA